MLKTGSLRFEPPDTGRFPGLDRARRAGEAGRSAPIVLNAANEVAVERFLNREIALPDVWRTVEVVMQRHTNCKHPSLGDIFAADAWARAAAMGN